MLLLSVVPMNMALLLHFKLKEKYFSEKKLLINFYNLNKNSFKKFGINFSIYHRTSDKSHHETAQEIFSDLENNNIFTKKTTDQYYDTQHNQFLADRYIVGKCPKCGYEHAYGDQCEMRICIKSRRINKSKIYP